MAGRTFTDLVNLDNVGMAQGGGGASFGQESLQDGRMRKMMGQQGLNGHDAIETFLSRFEDRSHASPTHFFEQFEIIQDKAGKSAAHLLARKAAVAGRQRSQSRALGNDLRRNVRRRKRSFLRKIYRLSVWPGWRLWRWRHCNQSSQMA